MNIIGRDRIMQRWGVIQHDLMPELKQECGALTPKLEKRVHVLDWVRIEEWSMQTWLGTGRKPHDRSARLMPSSPRRYWAWPRPGR